MSEPNDPSRRDGAKAKDETQDSRPGEADLARRLDALGTSIGQVKSRSGEPAATPRKDTSSASGAALAFRLGAEFVSGVLVGSLIGYGLDYAFAISPWGLIAFTLIGFAAGVLNMLRVANSDAKRHSADR